MQENHHLLFDIEALNPRRKTRENPQRNRNLHYFSIRNITQTFFHILKFNFFVKLVSLFKMILKSSMQVRSTRIYHSVKKAAVHLWLISVLKIAHQGQKSVEIEKLRLGYFFIFHLLFKLQKDLSYETSSIGVYHIY